MSIACDGSGKIAVSTIVDGVNAASGADENNTFTGDNEFSGDTTFSGDTWHTGVDSFEDIRFDSISNDAETVTVNIDEIVISNTNQATVTVIPKIVACTQAVYDALTPEPTTVYFIKD